MNRIEWDEIYEDNQRDDITLRAKVIGGWLVRHRSRVGYDEERHSMVFIPDANHTWEKRELGLE